MPELTNAFTVERRQIPATRFQKVLQKSSWKSLATDTFLARCVEDMSITVISSSLIYYDLLTQS